ncbi:MAG: hypothetical protein JXA54_08280 [Candidatus Heimdallarchaeota archaeon]|nr:hypothetical protein [Candidatus Heimdallarchaeota archaeon]
MAEIDEFKLAINIMLAVYALIVTFIFLRTWRKRSDLIYWFIALIIFSIGHLLLIFRQFSSLIRIIGNAILLAALLIVVITSFIEYYLLMIKKQEDEKLVNKEKQIMIFTILPFIIASSLSTYLLLRFISIDSNFSIIVIMVLMIGLILPLSIFLLRIYQKQKTITRLFMFFTFISGIFTALSTIFSLFFIWGVAMNDVTNFIFITLIMTCGLAAPIELRITISEEKYRILSGHLEEKVEERTKQLEAVNAELESFSYSVSHDLRSPLRSIIGFSDILNQEFSQMLDQQGKDYIVRIMKNSERMDEMITDLLKLSHLPRNDLNLEIVNLSIIAHEVMESLLEAYPETNINFKIQDELIAKCDQKFIRIVFENLLGNAIKFTINNSEPIIIFGKEKQCDETVFFIKDNGVGFEMQYYSKLFGLFQRLHNSDEFPGIGIGLITAKRIIEKHKGKIWAYGEINKGATFYFTLP